jgi:hypothetical protein
MCKMSSIVSRWLFRRRVRFVRVCICCICLTINIVLNLIAIVHLYNKNISFGCSDTNFFSVLTFRALSVANQHSTSIYTKQKKANIKIIIYENTYLHGVTFGWSAESTENNFNQQHITTILQTYNCWEVPQEIVPTHHLCWCVKHNNKQQEEQAFVTIWLFTSAHAHDLICNRTRVEHMIVIRCWQLTICTRCLWNVVVWNKQKKW